MAKQKYYQVFQNTDLVGNPNDVEDGIKHFAYVGLATCVDDDFNSGPIDAENVEGMEEQFETVEEFKARAKELHCLVKACEI